MRILLLLLLLGQSALAQQPYSVFLIGDAGADSVAGSALKILGELVAKRDSGAVLFLGDNVYPHGLHAGDGDAQNILKGQMNVVRAFPGSVYFIPGNHDWQAQRRKGLEYVLEQERFVNEYFASRGKCINKGANFLPGGGFPGPSCVPLTPTLDLLVLDSQWFIHFYKKSYTGSLRQTRDSCLKQVEKLLMESAARGSRVLVAAHHPVISNGRHSGKRQPWRFLLTYTPFRVFGFFGLNRMFSQDLPNPRYAAFARELLDLLDKHDNVIYAAGHEHNLQVLSRKEKVYVISGAGSKLVRLSRRRPERALFEDDQHTGLIELRYREKTVEIIVHRAGKDPVTVQ